MTKQMTRVKIILKTYMHACMHASIHIHTYIHYVTYVGPYFATPTAPRSLGRVCVSFMVGLVDGLVPMTNLYEDRFPTKKI